MVQVCKDNQSLNNILFGTPDVAVLDDSSASAPSLGVQRAPFSFETPFPITQFPWSSNTCASAINKICHHGNATARLCACVAPVSVPSESTQQETPYPYPYPFPAPAFDNAQFPWSTGSTAPPFYAEPKYYNSTPPYGLPQHNVLLILSPIPITPLFSIPYSPCTHPYTTPSVGNPIKHITCCCKCHK